MAIFKRFPVFEGILLILVLHPESHSLKLKHLEVPSSVELNESVWLNCSLDLEGDQLYSIKWYKNAEEFYRYLPNDNTPVQSYQLPGIYINENTSVEGHVLLQKMDYNSEGVYRCEASAEAPSFQTVSDEKELKVYVLPLEKPEITGSLSKYETGDNVNISCQSGKSHPPPVLKWFINDIEAEPNDVIRYLPVNDSDGLSSARMDLVFRVEPEHLKDNLIKFRCQTFVSQRFSMSAEETITSDHSSTEQDQTKHKPSGAPTISGGQEKYRIGDTLHVNCTSAISVSPTELKWFINDKQADPSTVLPGVTEDGERPTLGLKFVVDRKNFDEGGELRLKCTSTLSKVINILEDERHVMGSHRARSVESEPPKVGTDLNSAFRCYSLPDVLVLILLPMFVITC